MLHDRFRAEVGERLSPTARAALAAVVAGHASLLRRQAAGNLTVAHGDAHAWNFMHPLTPTTDRARLIDWECWDIEPGTNDLASLMAVHWFSDLRQAWEGPLLERYHRGLLAAGVTDYPLDACWTDYRWSVIERTLNPLYQWRRGRPVTSWWPNLARVLAAFEDLRCRELLV